MREKIQESRKQADRRLVADARRACNYSIHQLAGMTGIPDFILKSIESGRREPSLEEIHQLSKTLGLDPMDLVESVVTKKNSNRNTD